MLQWVRCGPGLQKAYSRDEILIWGRGVPTDLDQGMPVCGRGNSSGCRPGLTWVQVFALPFTGLWLRASHFTSCELQFIHTWKVKENIYVSISGLFEVLEWGTEKQVGTQQDSTSCLCTSLLFVHYSIKSPHSSLGVSSLHLISGHKWN